MSPDLSKDRSRIAILGAGSVGSAIALCLILNPVASEVLLVDPKAELRDAQVKDLSDATTYHGAVGYVGLNPSCNYSSPDTRKVEVASGFAVELTRRPANVTLSSSAPVQNRDRANPGPICWAAIWPS